MHLVDVAQAPRHGGHVDGRVAPADDDDAPAHMLHAAVVESLEESGGGDAVRRLRAFDRQRPAALRTQAEEHCVEGILQIVERDVTADAARHARLHAHVENALNFGIENGARCAESRNAVAHHAAEQFTLVEDRHGVALARELIRHRQACRAGADYRDLFAGGGGGFGKRELVFNGPFAEDMFDRVDADKIFHHVAVAA